MNVTAPTFSPISYPTLAKMTVGQGWQDLGTAVLAILFALLQLALGLFNSAYDVFAAAWNQDWNDLGIALLAMFFAILRFFSGLVNSTYDLLATAIKTGCGIAAARLLQSWAFIASKFLTLLAIAQPHLFAIRDGAKKHVVDAAIPYLKNKIFPAVADFFFNKVLPFIYSDVLPTARLAFCDLLQCLLTLLQPGNQGLSNLYTPALNCCSMKFFLWTVFFTCLFLLRAIPTVTNNCLAFKRRVHHLCARLFPQFLTTNNPSSGPRRVPEHLVTENVTVEDLQPEPIKNCYTHYQAQHKKVQVDGKTKTVRLFPNAQEGRLGHYPSTNDKASVPTDEDNIATIQRELQVKINKAKSEDVCFMVYKSELQKQSKNTRGPKQRNVPRTGETIRDVTYVNNHPNNMHMAHQNIVADPQNTAKFGAYKPCVQDLEVDLHRNWVTSYGNKRRRIGDHNGGVGVVDRHMYQPPH